MRFYGTSSRVSTMVVFHSVRAGCNTTLLAPHSHIQYIAGRTVDAGTGFRQAKDEEGDDVLV